MVSDKSNKLKYLLTKLDEKNISYVSWKDNSDLEIVFKGEGDIDLFIPIEHKQRFIELSKSLDWIEVINPVAKHPWTSHFYRLGDSLEIFHVHAYFKLITGETWLKEYLLPLDNWMIENRIWSPTHKIWVMNNSSQCYLFLIRHLLKGGSFSSRLIYKMNLRSYEEEWKACGIGIRPEEIRGPIDLSKYLNRTGVFEEKFQLPKISTSILFRLSISPFLRYNLFSLPLRRIHSFCIRLVNKILSRQKKIFPCKGLTIAISGVDGSGKTSMLEEINRTFGQFITINQFHLGRPQGKLIEQIWRFISNKNESSAVPGTSKINTPTSVIGSINGTILSLLRLLKARSIINRANRGGLMLVDRWPTIEVGKMDGPRVILGENSGWLKNFCKEIETWAYSRMPSADICYFLKVPIEVAKERNRFRVKQNKETEKMIVERFYANFKYKPIAKKVIRFENSGSFKVKHKELLDSIWHEISNRYKSE